MDPFYTRFFPAQEWNSRVSYHAELRARQPEAVRILDLGCGANTELARYRNAEHEVWGVDFQMHPHIHHGEWFRLLEPNGGIPFPASHFDLVASTLVLEHVADPAAFLGEVTRVLKPGGSFVALTINGGHYVTWITRLVHWLPHRLAQSVIWRLYKRPHHDTFRTYYRLNTRTQMERAAADTGLKLVSLTHLASPLYFRFWQPAMRAAVLLDYCLERLRPGLGKIYQVATLQKPPARVAALPRAA